MEHTEKTAPRSLMSQDEAVSTLVSYIFSGIVGSAKGKGLAALEAEENEGEPIDWYGVRIERESRRIQSPTISYRVCIEEDSQLEYVLQLRHHDHVTSMNLLISLISSIVDSDVLPLPTVYPISNEEERQKTTGMGRQIRRLIPGQIAHSVYGRLPHEEKLKFVKNMALAFQACWQTPFPKERLIGELCAPTWVPTTSFYRQANQISLVSPTS